MDGRAKPLIDRKMFGVVLFGVVAVVTSTTTAECSVLWCGVASCRCSCSGSCSCSVVEVETVVVIVVVAVVVVVVV